MSFRNNKVKRLRRKKERNDWAFSNKKRTSQNKHSGIGLVNEPCKAIKRAVAEEGCEEIFVDTISSLLIYHQGFFIIKFAHELRNGEVGRLKPLKESVLVALKGDPTLEKNYESLMMDLSMFADEVVH